MTCASTSPSPNTSRSWATTGSTPPACWPTPRTTGGARSTRSECRSCAASATTGSGGSMRSRTRSVRCAIGSAPERWIEFKKDMNFFQNVMGPEYLSTLTDHGANATPVWVFFGRLLMAHAPASEGLLITTGLVDGLSAAADGGRALAGVRPLADVAGDDRVRRQRPLHVRHQLDRRDPAARLAGAARLRRGRAQAPALDAWRGSAWRSRRSSGSSRWWRCSGWRCRRSGPSREQWIKDRKRPAFRPWLAAAAGDGAGAASARPPASSSWSGSPPSSIHRAPGSAGSTRSRCSTATSA